MDRSPRHLFRETRLCRACNTVRGCRGVHRVSLAQRFGRSRTRELDLPAEQSPGDVR